MNLTPLTGLAGITPSSAAIWNIALKTVLIFAPSALEVLSASYARNIARMSAAVTSASTRPPRAGMMCFLITCP